MRKMLAHIPLPFIAVYLVVLSALGVLAFAGGQHEVAAQTTTSTTASPKASSPESDSTATTRDQEIYTSYSGEGSEIIEIAPHDEPLLLHIWSGDPSGGFTIRCFDSEGEETPVDMSYVDSSYEGYVLLDWRLCLSSCAKADHGMTTSSVTKSS